MSHRFVLISICMLSGIISCTPSHSGASQQQVSGGIQKTGESQHDFKADSHAVQKVLELQATAWNNGDIDGFMTGYWHSDSLKFITKNGIRLGYDSVASNYKKHYNTKDKLGRLNFSNLNIMPLNPEHSIIQVTGKWEVIQKAETLSGIFSLLFRRVNGEWKIIVDHTW